MGRKGYKGINIGLASIVVMFVVIALTIFAALSVSTAAQEKQLAEKYADSVSAYWSADAECAEVANAFGALWESAADETALERLAGNSDAQMTKTGYEILVSYSRPISETSALEVTLRLGDEFSIEKWRMVTTDEDWNPDTSLPVWKG